MIIKELRELKRYNLDELCTIFEKDENETKEIMKTLGIYNISKRISTMTSEELEMENLLDEEEIGKIKEKNIYVFKFVGIISVGNICLIIHPKYIENFDEYISEENKAIKYEDIRQLIEVIRKYKNKKEQNQNTNVEDEEKNFNLLSLALDLYYDYYENGLYHNEKVIIEENGQGEIFWEKTINEQTTYFVNNRPMYLDLYTFSSETNEEDFFRRLHRLIITKCCEDVKELFKILDLKPIVLSTEEIENFGDKEYLLRKLDQELSSQFVTKKQKQLNMIKTYLIESENSSEDTNVKFIGSTSFNLIWEDVCSVVMENSLDKKLKDLGLEKIFEKLNKNVYLKDVIEKPKWYKKNEQVKESDKTLIPVGESDKTLIPDIVTVKKEEKKIYIYDAKYYNIVLGKDKVKKEPGIGDITKQYLYELAFKKLARENEFKIVKNAFLMPVYKKENKYNENIENIWEEIGKVEFGLMNSLITDEEDKLNDIDVILLPVNEVYRRYL